jgi:AraC-like DNA-binding protein
MHSSPEPVAMPGTTCAAQPPRRAAVSRRAAYRVIEAAAPADPIIRLRVGGIHGAYRPFPNQRAVTLTPSDSLIYVILPLVGGVVAATAEDTHEAGAGEALLLARAERVSCVWHPGSAGLVLHIPRAWIQAAAARLFDEPCRLAGAVSVFAWDDRPAFLGGPPFEPGLIDNSLRPAASVARQRVLCESLVHAIEKAGLGKAAFSVAKSVMRALAHVRANPSGAWTVEDLAPVAGVTAATLRKNFRACLGLTVTQVVREARLQWVRDQLASTHESRSIAALAEAAAFGGAGVLARAYQQHFGETPTQTRARAFASG